MTKLTKQTNKMSTISSKELINGILLVNKPQGLSSNAVLQKVKRLYNAKKAGHTGSLDPLATGMLPVCFGEATKFCQYVLEADKTYQATGLLGIKTTTGDSCGEPIASTDNFCIDESQLLGAVNHFIGHSQQLPSMFSALKHKGTPLYKYAREGITIERPTRPIHIKHLEMTAFDGKHFEITVTCSKGTYIRNLIEDIGDCLGVGAHVVQLHRQYTAGYLENKMYSLDELQEVSREQLTDYLLPMETAVAYLPAVTVSADELINLMQGRFIGMVNQKVKTGCVRIYDHFEQFAGLGMLDQTGTLKVRRLLSEHTLTSRL